MATEREPAWFVEQGAPVLRGVHCSACGADAFPVQSYGCIVCGADGEALQPRDLATTGILLTYAVVRTHATHAVPFTLGDIQLDAGPIVRAQLSDGMQPVIGRRLRGVVLEDEQGPHLEFVEEDVQ